MIVRFELFGADQERMKGTLISAGLSKDQQHNGHIRQRLSRKGLNN